MDTTPINQQSEDLVKCPGIVEVEVALNVNLASRGCGLVLPALVPDPLVFNGLSYWNAIEPGVREICCKAPGS